MSDPVFVDRDIMGVLNDDRLTQSRGKGGAAERARHILISGGVRWLMFVSYNIASRLRTPAAFSARDAECTGSPWLRGSA